MTPCKELHALLSNEILKEFESVGAKIASFAADHELSEEQNQEFEAIKSLKAHFEEIVDAIENRRIDEENCEKVLDELHGMREMGEHLGF